MPAIAAASNSDDVLAPWPPTFNSGAPGGDMAGSAAILPSSEVQKTLSSTAPTRVTTLCVCVAVGNLVVTVASPSALLTSTEILSRATDRPLSWRIWMTAKVMIFSKAASSASDNRRPVASNNRRPPFASKEKEKETMYSAVGARGGGAA
eukprot:scaffold9603_cov65-Phaeocystis_antarctica.AAC.1